MRRVVDAGMVAVISSVLVASCNANGEAVEAPAAAGGETQKIIANLVQAGFPSDDIIIAGGVVYVGRDAAVSLEASREMLAGGGASDSKEQYRTTNLVSSAVTRICVDGSAFSGSFSTALDSAIANYNGLGLSFTMLRTTGGTLGCGATIKAVIASGVTGGFSGFPAGGLPFNTVNIGDGLTNFAVSTITHVITHELGHTIGFRHSDYFNRSISCGSGGDEGDAGVGATLIAGTPSGATVGGSVMNSCFRPVEPGTFTATDAVALRAMYRFLDGGPEIAWHNSTTNETQVWFMLDRQIRARGTVVDENGSPIFIGLPWRIVAISDNEIAWHNDSTSETQIWFMAGNQIARRATVVDELGHAIFIGLPWSIVGGDSGEIAWHNSVTNETQIWFMSGNQIVGRGTVVDESGNAIFIGLPWSIVGADAGEIVWHNSSTNETQVWFMTGRQRIARRGTVADESGNAIFIGWPWNISGAHGSAIVWHNSSTSETQIWFMTNGQQIARRGDVIDESGNTIFIGSPWNVVGSSGVL